VERIREPEERSGTDKRGEAGVIAVGEEEIIWRRGKFGSSSSIDSKNGIHVKKGDTAAGTGRRKSVVRRGACNQGSIDEP
jgi:hypothetical protein